MPVSADLIQIEKLVNSCRARDDLTRESRSTMWELQLLSRARVRSGFTRAAVCSMNRDGANKWVERTAAMRFSFDGDGLQTAVVAVASALPAAVAHPCRSAKEASACHAAGI